MDPSTENETDEICFAVAAGVVADPVVFWLDGGISLACFANPSLGATFTDSSPNQPIDNWRSGHTTPSGGPLG
jgi:hypothetical protein